MTAQPRKPTRPKSEPVAAAEPDRADVATVVQPTILCDGKHFEWIERVQISGRSIQLHAKPGTPRNTLAEALDVDAVTLDGVGEPISIAARVISPPHIQPARVSMTTREPIRRG